jgi:hypothetical protein
MKQPTVVFSVLTLRPGIRRVKGVKKLGVRLGNWLTAEQGHALWQAPDSHRMNSRAVEAWRLQTPFRRHKGMSCLYLIESIRTPLEIADRTSRYFAIN